MSPKEEPSPETVINFMDIPVRKPSGVPLQAFSEKPGDFFDFFVEKYIASKGGKVTAINTLAPETIVQIAESVRSKYPDLSQNPFKPEDFERVKRDFPSLKSQEDFDNNAEVVYEYYENLIRNEIAPKIALAMQAGSGGKPTNSGDANALVSYLSIENPLTAAGVLSGRNLANQLIDEVYGIGFRDEQDNDINAFKHATWNACSINRLITAGKSKYGAIHDTRMLTNAHEVTVQSSNSGTIAGNVIRTWVTQNTQVHFSYVMTPASVMDLHNNLAGRTYMENNVKWGIFSLRRMPTINGIRDFFSPAANNSTINQDSQSLMLYNYNYLGLADVWTGISYSNAITDGGNRLVRLR